MLSICAFCLYVTLIWCNGISIDLLSIGLDVSSVYVHSLICENYLVYGIPYIYCQLEWGGRCILSICAFCYMWNLFGGMVFHRSIVNWSGGRCMLSIYGFCYMWFHRLIWCNSICAIHLLFIGVGGRCILSICAFCYTWKLCGVMVFHRFIVNWSGGYMYAQYMCILLYVTQIWCNGIWYIYCWLEWGSRCILSICALC